MNMVFRLAPLSGRFSIGYSTVDSILLCIALLLFGVSELLLVTDGSRSVQLKAIGFVALLLPGITKPRISYRAILFLLLIVSVLLINYARSFNSNAAIEEFLRFLFPIAIIVALYKARNINAVAYFFVLFVISNNIYQIYAYVAYMSGLPALHSARLEMGYIIRAEGWIGFFSTFGFMNFCAFMLVRYGNLLQKRNKTLEYFFIIFSLLSTSIKVLAAFVVYFLFKAKIRQVPKYILGIIVFSFALIALQPKLVDDMVAVTDSKIGLYITQGNSARTESYRVMKESLLAPNLFGEGLGAFGGPASTKYHSPLYSKYKFNWYGLDDQLSTTDTLYPHVFVELGVVGGFVYLFFIFTYGQRNRSVAWKIIVISFFIDNLVSFALLSPPYFFSAAICMIYFSKNNNFSPDATFVGIPARQSNRL